jgi:hypothetical protein
MSVSRVFGGARVRASVAVRVLLALALVAGALTVVATSEPGGADCPVPVSGHWKGSWISESDAGTSGIEADLVFDGGAVSGRVDFVDGLPDFGAVTGTESCGSIFLDSVGTAAVLNGTLEANGTIASGTYSGSGDGGTWSAVAYLVPDPGYITTIAGRGNVDSAGDGDWATNADFVGIDGLAVDLDGNLVVSDSEACNIRVIARATGTFYGQAMVAGHVYRIAGGVTCASSGDGGPALEAELNEPRDVDVDPLSGDILVADTAGGAVRLIAVGNHTRYGQSLLAGNIYTIAGNGTAGSWNDGNGGPATSAGIGAPVGVAVDAAHNVAFADPSNHVVRRVTSDGIIDGFAGNGSEGDDGDGGPATGAGLFGPYAVAYDEHGNLAIGMDLGVRLVVDHDQTIFGQDFEAGNIYGIRDCSCTVRGIDVDPQGNLVFASDDMIDVLAAAEGDYYGTHILAGWPATIAGSGTWGFAGDGGPAVDARFDAPLDVSSDLDGNVFIADTYNDRIREIGSVWDPPSPVAIEVTQTVAPTTVGSGAAASWVLSVTNTGAEPAVGVVAQLDPGAGTAGAVDQFETSTGGSCAMTPDGGTCFIGTVAVGETETASGAVVAQGVSAPGSFTVSGGAYVNQIGGPFTEADAVVVQVRAPAQLPPGSSSGMASGTAQPGVIFQTSTKAPDAATPVRIQMKLPRRVAADSIGPGPMALGGRTAALVSYRPAARLQAATVPATPVPMSLTTTADEATTFCDGVCDGDVINVSPFSNYNDRKRPAKLVVTWDVSKKGAGISSKIYKRGDSKQSPRTILPTCAKAKTGYTNLPCVSKRKQMKTGDVQFTLLLLSGDPKFGRR